MEEFQQLNTYLEEKDFLMYVFCAGDYSSEHKAAFYDSWEPQKWNHGNGEMVILSERFPHMTFQLTCCEDGKHWQVYYKDGINEVCVGDVIYEQPKKIHWDSLLVF